MNRPDDEPQKADDDAIWRDIVASYGDRPEFPEAAQPEEVVVEQPPLPVEPAQPAELDAATWEDEGHFVPPEPPPVPRPQGVRALAWFGIFGIPAVMLVLLLLSWTPPSPIGLIMIVWFVAGFGYLVATMNSTSDPDRGWDDGAVL